MGSHRAYTCDVRYRGPTARPAYSRGTAVQVADAGIAWRICPGRGESPALIPRIRHAGFVGETFDRLNRLFKAGLWGHAGLINCAMLLYGNSVAAISGSPSKS